MYLSIILVVMGISLGRFRLIQLAALTLIVAILPSSFKVWQEAHQNKIALHLLKKGSAIDFIVGKHATSIEFGTIDEKSKKFIVTNCRSYLGVSSGNIDRKEASTKAPVVAQKGPFMQFQNKVLFSGDKFCTMTVRADIALFHEKFDWDTLQHNMQFGTVILHPSLPKRVKEKCMQYFGNKAKIITFDKPGTFVLDLNTSL